MSKPKVARTKEKNKNGNSILSVGLIVLILIAVGLSLFYVRIKVEEVSLGYEISRNKRNTQELLKENRILQSEFMKLKSPDKLEHAAKDLGFKFPTQQDIIYIEKSTVIGNK